jgi:hypothetical protein
MTRVCLTVLGHACISSLLHNPAQIVFSYSGMEFQLFAPKSIDREGVNPLPKPKKVA